METMFTNCNCKTNTSCKFSATEPGGLAASQGDYFMNDSCYEIGNKQQRYQSKNKTIKFQKININIWSKKENSWENYYISWENQMLHKLIEIYFWKIQGFYIKMFSIKLVVLSSINQKSIHNYQVFNMC